MDKIPKPSAIIEKQWKVIDKLKSAMFKQNTVNSKLQAQLAKHRWIPVEEGLPEERQDTVPYRSKQVFVTDGQSARSAFWKTRRMEWVYWGDGFGVITHWKPIILSERE